VTIGYTIPPEQSELSLINESFYRANNNALKMIYILDYKTTLKLII